MATKNFDGVGTQNRVQEAITEATTEPTARKERRTYTPEEKAELTAALSTRGRKGVKLPRINTSYTPELYEYVQTMSVATGLTLTQFINLLVKQHKDAHIDMYNEIMAQRENLK